LDFYSPTPIKDNFRGGIRPPLPKKKNNKEETMSQTEAEKKAEAEAKIKIEAEVKARAEAEKKAESEAEARKKSEAEAEEKEKAEARAEAKKRGKKIIKYVGPQDYVSVKGYGKHMQGTDEEYPINVANDLLASKKQKFEAA
jgi:hypothetical protein